MNAKPKRQRRTYDHRLRQLYETTGDPTVLKPFGIPRSTLHGWSHRRKPEIVSASTFDLEREALVRIPRDSGHRFRANPATLSG